MSEGVGRGEGEERRYLETSENEGMEEIADGLALDRCFALDVVWEGGV